MPRGDIVIGHPGTLSVTFVDMHAWLRQYLIEPSAALVQSMAVGEDLRDLEPCRTICTGIEGLFRDQVEQQYAAWPRGSTTDGFTADVCIRAAERTITVVGMCWLDFTGRQFPLRATIELDADEKQLSTFTAEIGETDQMHADGAAELGEEHRPEFAGADQTDGDGTSGGGALAQQLVQVHGLFPRGAAWPRLIGCANSP